MGEEEKVTTGEEEEKKEGGSGSVGGEFTRNILSFVNWWQVNFIRKENDEEGKENRNVGNVF